MNGAAAIMAAIGGVIAFLGAVYALIRSQVRQQSAVEENTRATRELTSKMDRMADKVSGHDGRLQSLEDWRATGGGAMPRWPRLPAPCSPPP